MQLLDLNRDYCEQIVKEKEAHAESALREIAYINQSTAKYHGRCVSTLYIPKIFTEDDICHFQRLIRDLYGIFDKVIRHYREDKNYRELFGFEKGAFTDAKKIKSRANGSCHQRNSVFG